MPVSGKQDNWALAVAAHSNGNPALAVQHYRQHLVDAPDDEAAAKNLIAALYQAGRTQDALEFGRTSAKKFPKSADILANIATVLSKEGHHDRAALLYKRALGVEPSSAETWLSLGQSCVKLGELETAISAFEKSVELQPDNPNARVQLIHQSQQILAWDKIDAHIAIVRKMIAQRKAGIDPWALMSICRDPDEHLRCATAYSNRFEMEAAESNLRAGASTQSVSTQGGRLRLGYVSADFREHPTSHLIVQLIESHDRGRIETFGYAIDPPNGGPMRQRMKVAFENFREVGPRSAQEIASEIAKDGLDILVDLMGYTQMARPDVLALRPAPTIIGYLGFPGSMGASFIDYMVADHQVIPAGHERYFSEMPIRMPFTYQVNDSSRPPIIRPEGDDLKQARTAAGLPENGTVFASFNQFYKLTPDILALWANILKQTEGSVLWVVSYSDVAVANLRRMLASSGVDPSRVIAAPIANQADHLQRYGIADIMLDTHPCGGHTTASDALRAGCVLVTLSGQTFAARVGASLLHALGFPQLIAEDGQAYAKLAIELARAPNKLKDLQREIWATAQSHPMFDGERFARDFETALFEIRRRVAAGEPPKPIDLLT